MECNLPLKYNRVKKKKNEITITQNTKKLKWLHKNKCHNVIWGQEIGPYGYAGLSCCRPDFNFKNELDSGLSTFNLDRPNPIPFFYLIFCIFLFNYFLFLGLEFAMMVIWATCSYIKQPTNILSCNHDLLHTGYQQKENDKCLRPTDCQCT